MNKKAVWTIVIVVIVIVIAVVAYTSSSASSGSPLSSAFSPSPTATPTDMSASSQTADNTAAATPAAIPTMQPTTQLFSNTRFASKSFLVWPGPLSSAAKTALEGFSLQTKDLGNGLTQITLLAQQQNYVTQTFTLASGQKLYFVETSMGDDQPGSDEELGDDRGVAVDASGYVLK